MLYYVYLLEYCIFCAKINIAVPSKDSPFCLNLKQFIYTYCLIDDLNKSFISLSLLRNE